MVITAGLLSVCYPLLLMSLHTLQQTQASIHAFSQQTTDAQNIVAKLQTGTPVSLTNQVQGTPFSSTTQKVSIALNSGRRLTLLVPSNPSIFP